MKTVTLKKVSMMLPAELNDLDYLNQVADLWISSYGVEVAKADKEFVQLIKQIQKVKDKLAAVESKKEAPQDYSKLDDTVKKNLVKSFLDENFWRGFGDDGTKMIVKVKDRDNKLVDAVLATRAISDQVEEEIVKAIEKRGITFAPFLIRELGQFWMYYGQRIPEGLVDYAGFDQQPWAYGRSLVQPAEGPMPTWDKFLSRMSDRQAFAAWIYGVASKKYKGRQVLWLQGGGEDGKTFVQKIISDYVFANATATISNSAMHGDSLRFVAASFEHKTLATWGDCNNQQILMSEFIKGVSAGGEGDVMKMERKGKDGYDTQLNTRLWINSNLEPIITNDTYARSRLLYVKLDRLDDAPDVDLRARFIAELPAFLSYAEQCYNQTCTDQRKIVQTAQSEDMIDTFTYAADSGYEAIFDNHFGLLATRNGVDAYVRTSSISNILTSAGLKDSIKQAWFYTWLQKTHNLTKSKVKIDGKQVWVVKGLRTQIKL